jgi:hypothetical protein
MEKKIILFSKLPFSIKEGFEKALNRDELESTTVSIKGEYKLGVIYKEEDVSYLIIMDTPAVQEIEDEVESFEDEMDYQDEID